MADFASRLRQLRTKRNLRQIDLARALNVAQTTIANYEQHSRFPDEAALRRIADYFHVSLDYLLGRIDVEMDPGEYGDTAGGEATQARLSPLAARYLETVLAGNSEAAYRLVENARARGHSAEELYLEVLAPALHAVGRMWQSGEADVADEHLLTAVTQRLMHRLAGRFSSTGRTRGTLVAATVPGETHEIGLRMVCDFLMADGWHVVYLGTHVPVNSLMGALERHGAHLLALSATEEEYLEPLSAMTGLLRRGNSNKQLKVLMGGMPFNRNPKLFRQVGGDGYAQNASEAVSVAGRLWSTIQRRRA